MVRHAKSLYLNDAEMLKAVLADNERLLRPWRNVDDLDWTHLANFIPDSGHGRFWKSVLAEMRTALETV